MGLVSFNVQNITILLYYNETDSEGVGNQPELTGY